VKVNLGSGRERHEGYVNLDLNPNSGAEWIHDVRRLPFQDNEIDAFRAQDILEHLPYRETVPVLKEWHRCLKPDGRLDFCVPAADVIMMWWSKRSPKLLQKLPDDLVGKTSGLSAWNGLVWRLLGGQDDGVITKEGDDPVLNLHQQLFSYESLTEALDQAGFHKIGLTTNDHPNYVGHCFKQASL
jgi:SAM-dependent methyltransferase